jgi:HD superfamily phosphohydrolase
LSVGNAWDNAQLIEELGLRYEREGLTTEWVSEKRAVQIALQAIEKHLSNGRYTPKKALGVGGSGIVLRLEDRMFPEVDKALKFPRPVNGRIAVLTEMLTKEINHLANLRHPGIVSIVDYATLESVEVYQRLPFYIMEFVDGKPSRDFVRARETTEEQFRLIVRDTVGILSYLHAGRKDRIAHLDLKAENIMVTASGRPVLIDLGTCKRLTKDDALTLVACTRSNAHPELIHCLQEDPSDNNRARGELPRSKIDPNWDLWAFGLTLLDWLGVDRDSGAVSPEGIYHRLKAYTRKYYILMAARLLSYSVRSWLCKRVGLSEVFLKDFPVTSATELCEVLERLESSGGPLAKIEEFSIPSSGTIQAALGLHLALTPALKTLIEHRLYRRLSSITQLGIVSQVYPGAKHTRREHSLGTYANVIRMLRALYEDSYSPLFRQIVTEDDCRALLLATLLHDIGQFPLAHDLEDIDNRIFSHSELTHAMLKGEWSRKKRGSKPLSFDSLQDVFSAWKTTAERVAAILSAKPTAAGANRRDKLLRSFFSGPVDADKLDYLLRDATHTDVPYPLGIDVGMLLKCLTVVVLEQPSARDVPTIGIHAKGRVAAEFLTLARYAMFSQVYWHHAVRAQKVMLARAVGALLVKLTSEEAMEGFKADFLTMVAALPEVLYMTRPQVLFPELEKDGGLDFGTFGYGTDLAATDAAVLAWFQQRLHVSKLPEASLIKGLLERRLFKRLWVISHDMNERRWEKIVPVWDKLNRSQRNQACQEFEERIQTLLASGKISSVTTLKGTDALNLIQEKTAGKIPWLLIDIPSARPGADVGLYYVLEGQRRQLRKNDRATGELQASEIWNKYAKELRSSAGKIRIYSDPILADTIEASIDTDKGLDELEAAVTEVAS